MSDLEKNTEGFIPKHGGYGNLFSYQKAEIIYAPLFILLIAFFTHMAVLLVRWFRPRGVENRILQKEA